MSIATAIQQSFWFLNQARACPLSLSLEWPGWQVRVRLELGLGLRLELGLGFGLGFVVKGV